MRKLHIGTDRYTEVFATDEPAAGGACHRYVVARAATDGTPRQDFLAVSFQNGPIRKTGVNGIHHEDLIAILIDRLRYFQVGPYACRENALALTKLEEALHWLDYRTRERQARGVEGTSAP